MAVTWTVLIAGPGTSKGLNDAKATFRVIRNNINGSDFHIRRHSWDAFGNDGESGKGGDLYCLPLLPTPLPPEVIAQEKDIEAIFQHLIADSREAPAVREHEASAVWIGVVVLCILSALVFWLLALISQ